ncbi:hypothetical protein MRX96_050601 [Rhipicephalus microplus]
MAPNNWDPLIFAHEQPSEQCTVRVKRDLAEFNANPPPGIFVAAEENNISKVHAIIVGPVGTPYEGGLLPVLSQVSNRLPDESTAGATHNHGCRPGALQPALLPER